MALNINPNQELYLIFEDGHSEKVIDGLTICDYKQPLILHKCDVRTTNGLYRVEVTATTIELPFKINTKDVWYKWNPHNYLFEPIDGITYKIKEKENE